MTMESKLIPDEASYDWWMTDSSSPFPADLDRRTRVDQLREVLTTLHLIGMAKMVDRSIRRLSFSGIKLLRSLARMPVVGRGFDPLLARIDTHDRLQFELEELLRVCTALNEEHVPYWVAGGWGLDALVGCQTRRHRDLDLVVHPFHESLPQVAALLTSLGYERKTPFDGTVWFPYVEVYIDSHGHDVQVLIINWDILTTVEELLGSTSSAEAAATDGLARVTQLMLARFTSTGTLEGVAIPALSLVAQRLFHLGYPQRPEEPHAEDIIRLISMGQDGWINPLDHGGAPRSLPESRQPSTLLLIPIFTFPPDLWRLCRLYHNDLMVPPHVTLAIPFKPLKMVTDEVVQQLTKLFQETPQFEFELNAVRWFDADVVYLEPSNAEAFRSITERIQHEFPDFRPYGGVFDDVIPHVTLSEHGSIADRRIIGRLATQYTPISARASQVWLMSNNRDIDDWAVVKVFNLGPAPLGASND
jgi:2'-5' RNA ligase